MQKEKAKETKQEIRQEVTLLDRSNNNVKYKQKHFFGNKRRRKKSNTRINLFTSHNLKAISYLQIDYMLEKGIFCNNHTPEKIIKDIFPIIKDSISDFVDSKTFSEKTKPIDFLSWIIILYNDFQKDDWSIEYDVTTDTYKIKRYYEYWQIGQEGRSVGLRFMPELKNINKKLYKLLTDLFYFLLKNKGIPFWFTNEYYDYAVEYIEGEIDEYVVSKKAKGEEVEINTDEEEYYANMVQVIQEYKEGNVKTTREDILSNKKRSLKNLENNLKKFKPKNNTEEFCIEVIENGLELLRSEKKFYDFVNLTEEELQEGYPGTPYEFACLGWSYKREDPLESFHMDNYESITAEYGVAPFRQVFYNNDNSEPDSFPLLYVEWLSKIGELEDRIMEGL